MHVAAHERPHPEIAATSAEVGVLARIVHEAAAVGAAELLNCRPEHGFFGLSKGENQARKDHLEGAARWPQLHRTVQRPGPAVGAVHDERFELGTRLGTTRILGPRAIADITPCFRLLGPASATPT
jgi:hypothetical protein